MTLDDTARTLGKSQRTIHRWVASGKLKTEERDGRTMVDVEAPPSEAIAQLQRQAEDTGRVAAMAVVTGQQTAIAYQGRVEELERRVADERTSARWWRGAALVACAMGVMSLVTLAATWATGHVTRDIVTATERRAETAERALARAETALGESQRAQERLMEFIVGVTWGDTMADSVARAEGQ